MQITERERQEAISIELADLYQRQMTLILCNRLLHFDELDAVSDVFYELAEEDIWIFERIAAAMQDSPIQSDAKRSTVFLAETVMEIVSEESNLHQEKLSSYLLLKQSQLSSCRILERSLRVLGKKWEEILISVGIVADCLEAQLDLLSSQVEDRAFAWITGEPELILARDRFAARAKQNRLNKNKDSEVLMGKVIHLFSPKQSKQFSKR
ncbi:MAG: hypothetical protein EOP07_00260 [Proteobacteria bacterium]|nr:MAG: hypothetical protein EOP07_00260 [Pseudomonadota bacterium]